MEDRWLEQVSHTQGVYTGLLLQDSCFLPVGMCIACVPSSILLPYPNWMTGAERGTTIITGASNKELLLLHSPHSQTWYTYTEILSL